MKMAVLRVFVSLAGVAGLLVGVPSVAHAATGYNRCPPARMCLFSGLNGTGGIAYFQCCSADLRQQGMDNVSKSEWNRTGQVFSLWTGYSYGGSCSASYPNPQGGNLASQWRNVFSSLRVESPVC